MNMLEIKDLHVEIEGKPIIKGLHLTVKNNSVHALMGPNGSGKSTLAHALMGHPSYTITKGSIIFKGTDITTMPPHERARLGLFLSFQYPSEISGVKTSTFLRTAINAQRKEPLSVMDFQELLTTYTKKLQMDPAFMQRYLNEGFSGGEKKRMEILQMLMLNPSLAILDETDSGLDIDALRIVAQGVSSFKSNEDKSVLVITHYKRILDLLKPDSLSIMQQGVISKEGGPELIDHLEEKGYGWLEE